MVNQKQGVYAAVVAFCEEHKIAFEDGMKLELKKEQRATVVEMVTKAMSEGEIELSPEARAKHNTPQKIKTYCNGLVSNWLRKDKRLNGGEVYQIKNPGSRAGQGDEILKNLKLLHKQLDDDEQKAAVQVEIDKRTEELQKEKIKNVAPDYSHIPAELLEQLGIEAPTTETTDTQEEQNQFEEAMDEAETDVQEDIE